MTNCMVCLTELREYGTSHVGSVRVPHGNSKYLRCPECGLVCQQDSLDITEGELYKYYQGEMTWEQYKERRLRESKEAWKVNEFYHKYIRKYAPSAESILDMGAGTGQFLHQAKDFGYKVRLGTEYSEKGARFAKEVYNENVILGWLELDKQFDVITMIQVIEHLILTRVALEQCRDYLKETGILVIATPDVACPISKIKRMNWHSIHNHHIMLYTVKALCRLLTQCGYKVVAVKRNAMFSGNWVKSYKDYILGSVLSGHLLYSSNADGMIVIAQRKGG